MIKLIITIFFIFLSFSTKAQTTLVVPFPPGGTIDLVARLIANTAKDYGHSVIIENRAGAEGRIAYNYFAKIKNNPNILLMGASGPMYFTQLLDNTEPEYNIQTNFKSVIHMGKAYHFILSHPSTQIHNMRDLIKNKREMNFVSGNATSRFLLEHLFKEIKLNAQVIPYNGAAPSFIAMLSGYVPFGAGSTPSASIYVNAGKLNAIAITSLNRIPQAPKVPTIHETLKNNFEVFSTFALLGPGDMSKERLEFYNRLFNLVLNDKNLSDKFYEYHIQKTGGTPDILSKDIHKQINHWKKVHENFRRY